jgi:hypothetical protein
MLGPDDTPETFWARFLAMAAAVPDLLSAVSHHMRSIDRKSLHGVNCAMRAAMNATVKSIRCSELTLPTHQQLHEVFPNACSMDLCVEGFISEEGLFVNDLRVHLQQLVSSSEALLNGLKHLSVTLRLLHPETTTDGQAILALLTRYATRADDDSG